MNEIATPLHPDRIRAGFPSLRDGRTFLDNPGGTQVHHSVYDAIAGYYRDANANLGGPFVTSVASEEIARGCPCARPPGSSAPGAGEIVFGANMTTLTMHASRTLFRDLGPGDEVLVTGLDHDANVAPWLLAAEDRGVTVRQVAIDPEVCVVDPDAFAALLTDRTRVAAFGWASNGAGTVNDVAALCALCRDAGALSYVDAVHFAPHGPIDVAAIGCDFLVCSAYKFFGPHVGILFGRAELLDATGRTRCVRLPTNRPIRGRPARSTSRASPAPPLRCDTCGPWEWTPWPRTSAGWPCSCSRGSPTSPA